MRQFTLLILFLLAAFVVHGQTLNGGTGNLDPSGGDGGNATLLQGLDTTALLNRAKDSAAIVSYLQVNITTVNTATYDLLVTDYLLNVTYTETGAVTSLTLPSAQTIEGRVIVIKDTGNASTYSITIDTEGSETIDGDATLILDSDYEAVNLYSDGSNWFVF